MATWACGHRAIQSNEIAAGRKRIIMMEGWWEGERVEAEMSGWKYDITLYTSAGPWQQSNTLDLRSSLSRFFQLVKTEAGGLLEKEMCLDCLHVMSICSVQTKCQTFGLLDLLLLETFSGNPLVPSGGVLC